MAVKKGLPDIPKLLVWMNMPSHHQSAFFRAMREFGFDLVVHYYGRVTEARKMQGWEDPEELPTGERFVSADIASLHHCPDWENRIHIVPGYGSTFLREMAVFLSRRGARWMHWSEPAFPGLRWWLGYVRRRWYAGFVNTRALGALAIGVMAQRDFLRWGITADRIHFLPYAAAPVSSSERDEILDTFVRRFPCTFLFIGSLCHRKGVDILLKAFRRVLDRHPHAGLVLVGLDMQNGAYAALANRLNLSHNVMFRGVIPSGNIGAALAACQVVVLPSRFDGWGMVLSEAASVGKALIATKMCGAAHHFITDGENGYRVISENIAALADAMCHYAAHPALATHHGNASLKLYSEFTPERNAMRLQQVLERVTMMTGNSRRRTLCSSEIRKADRE